MLTDISVDIELAKSLSIQKRYIEAYEKYVELLGQIGSMNRLQQIMVYLGMCHIARIKLLFSEAIEYFEKALGLDPRNRFAFNGITNSYRGLKNHVQEIYWWKQILIYCPKFINVMTMVANIYCMQEYFNDSLYYCQNAYDIDLSNRYVLFGLADTFPGIHLYADVNPVLGQYLDNNGKGIRALTCLGNMYMRHFLV